MTIERKEVHINRNRSLAPIEQLLGISHRIPDHIYETIVSNGCNILNLGELMPPSHRFQLVQNWQERRTAVLEENPIRADLLDKANSALASIPTLENSQSRLNPETVWEGDREKRPDIFFGMGGGSQSIIRGATLEALVMFMTAEAVRRKLNLGKVRAILADRITWTNLPYSSDFLPKGISQIEVLKIRNEQGPEAMELWKEIQEKINARMMAERSIYLKIIEKMGFPRDQWDIFLHRNIEEIIGKEGKEKYDQTTRAHNEILSGITGRDEYHYAMESGIIDSLVNGSMGGVKVGWFIREIDKKHGGYIMDEQPFDARYVLGEALRPDGHDMRVSFVYALAAPLLYPDAYGNLRKASPYICYNNGNMLTLHPDDDVYEKLKAATKAGGGLNFNYTRRFWRGMVALFEELTGVKLETVKLGAKVIEINDYQSTFPEERLALKIKAMKDYLLDGIEDEVRALWQPFEKDNPEASDGLPMKLPTMEYFEIAGIQEKGLNPRIRSMVYDDERFRRLAQIYGGDKKKLNLTRDLLILIGLTHEKIWDVVNSQEGYFSPFIYENEEIRRLYSLIMIIGINAGISFLRPDHEFYADREYQPDELLIRDAQSLPLNIAVVNEIKGLDNSSLDFILEKLEEFLTILSYPNTNEVKSAAASYGYDLSSLDDDSIKLLQGLAENFFEARQKGSTPIEKWREIYEA